MIGAVLRKIHRTVGQRGLVGACGHVARAMCFRALQLRPSRRRAARRKHERDLAFDRALGVDTAGAVHLQPAAWAGGVVYLSVDEDLFDEAMAHARVDHARYTFVDFGSGKGKALLLAARHAFRRVVGVEFAPALHEVALRNCQRDPRIEPICTDATDFALPIAPLILYLFNPFGAEVMTPLIDNVRRSYEAYPRDIRVVYLKPQHAALWARERFLEQVADTRDYAVFRTRQA